MANKKCNNCEWWRVYGHDSAGEIGECRRHPPVLHWPVNEGEYGEYAEYMATKFPITNEEMWCGEHEEVAEN